MHFKYLEVNELTNRSCLTYLIYILTWILFYFLCLVDCALGELYLYFDWQGDRRVFLWTFLSTLVRWDSLNFDYFRLIPFFFWVNPKFPLLRKISNLSPLAFVPPGIPCCFLVEFLYASIFVFSTGLAVYVTVNYRNLENVDLHIVTWSMSEIFCNINRDRQMLTFTVH